MGSKRELLLYTSVLIAVVLAASFAAMNITAMSSSDTEEKFKQAIESELENKCATPPDYTNESWRDHMSHHPERYKECLENA